MYTRNMKAEVMNGKRESRITTYGALLFFIFILASLASSCGARDRAADAGQPRAEQTPALILLVIPATREAATRTAWQTLLREQGIAVPESALNLSPVTKTITALPVNLRLPRVGDPAATGEQRATNERESLRRFINANSTLTGANGNTLTLLGIEDLANNTRRARYEHRPFVYPLRGGYGRITIDYTTDNRVLNLTSTALPEASAVNERVSALRARLTADEARAALGGKIVEIKSSNGSADQRTLPVDAESLRQRVRATELTVFPVPVASEGDEGRIVLHLAWELRFEEAGTPYFVYVDANSGEILDADSNREQSQS